MQDVFGLPRGFRDMPALRDDRPWRRADAWVWLVEHAASGRLGYTPSALATRWRWTRAAVHRFLAVLARDGEITLVNAPTRPGRTIPGQFDPYITLCKTYEIQNLSTGAVHSADKSAPPAAIVHKPATEIPADIYIESRAATVHKEGKEESLLNGLSESGNQSIGVPTDAIRVRQDRSDGEAVAKPEGAPVADSDSLRPPRSARTRTRATAAQSVVPDADLFSSADVVMLRTDHVRQAFDAYRATARRLGLIVPQDLTPSRREGIRLRLLDIGGMPGWSIALDKLAEATWITEGGWPNFSIDSLINRTKFSRLMEGAYVSRTTGKAETPADAMIREAREYREANPGRSAFNRVSPIGTFKV